MQTSKCPSCGRDNPSDAALCCYCGKSLSAKIITSFVELTDSELKALAPKPAPRPVSTPSPAPAPKPVPAPKPSPAPKPAPSQSKEIAAAPTPPVVKKRFPVIAAAAAVLVLLGGGVYALRLSLSPEGNGGQTENTAATTTAETSAAKTSLAATAARTTAATGAADTAATTSSAKKSIIPQRAPSPAEKAADIVMANEDMWLDLANVHFPEEKVEQLRNSEYAKVGIATYCGCWFEDLDFDGTPEFIMGGFNPGWQGGECYAIYRISDDKLERIYGDPSGASKWTDENCPMIYDTVYANHNHNYKVWMRPGLIAAGGGEIIKDKNGRFRFIIPFSGEHMGGYDLTELIVDGNSFDQTNHKIADFTYAPNSETRQLDIQICRLPDPDSDYGYRECTQSELLEAVDDFFEGAESYISTIGVIPCSNLMNDKDEKWLADGADTYADKTQRSCYNSSCYDNMTDEEKRQALIDSYEKYSFKKDTYTDEPYIYKRFVYDVKNEEKNWFHDYDF